VPRSHRRWTRTRWRDSYTAIARPTLSRRGAACRQGPFRGRPAGRRSTSLSRVRCHGISTRDSVTLPRTRQPLHPPSAETGQSPDCLANDRYQRRAARMCCADRGPGRCAGRCHAQRAATTHAPTTPNFSRTLELVRLHRPRHRNRRLRPVNGVRRAIRSDGGPIYGVAGCSVSRSATGTPNLTIACPGRPVP
jgi:hypothetical protein